MKFSYNWLKEYVPKLTSAQQAAEVLAMHIFEVETVEKSVNDWLLDIKVLANRAHDCLSHLGIARELAAILGTKLVYPRVVLNEDKNSRINDFLSVEVKEKDLCHRYSSRVVVDIKVGESPKWLQERLKTCGLRPINNIVDVTNYVMLECGQPLHAFDLDKIAEQKIIVRLAQAREKIITLDEGRAERLLDENTLVIADAKKAIGIAGIKGGRGTEIDSSTSRIVLEAANFNPVNIRKSSRTLGLRTDASCRFENAPDANLTLWALDRAVSLIVQLAQGKAISGVIDISAKKYNSWTVSVAHNYVENLLGIKLKPEQIMKIFKRLDLPVKQLKRPKDVFYSVTVPTRRPDLLTSEDLIEEIGRLHGYENILSVMPEGRILPVRENKDLIYLNEARRILTGLGYSEAQNYSFVSEEEKEFYGFGRLVEISNPLSRDQKYLRPNLAAGLIRNFQENLKYLKSSGSGFRLNELRLFEFGHVFSPSDEEVLEEKKIGGLVFLKDGAKSGSAFYEVKGVMEMFFERLGLFDEWDDEMVTNGLPLGWAKILNSTRSGHVHVGSELVGWIGEINPVILDQPGIIGHLAPVSSRQNWPAIFEIDFDKIVRLVNEERIYEPPSKFPAINRDLTVLVGNNTKIEGIINEIETAAGKLLQDTDLFDIFEDEESANGQKSVSFHLVFQSPERNLSDAEVNKLMEKVIKALEEKGWEVRR